MDEYLDKVEKQKEILIKSKRTEVVSYSTTVQGIYNYINLAFSNPYDLTSRIPKFIIVKKFRPEDFLLDFENLFELCNGEIDNAFEEAEVWMKATDYYSVANMDEIEVM